MGVKETFRGYGPEQGYDFLHEAIAKYYASFGVDVASDEIFISDGAKSDCGNMTDLFSNDNVILIPDPVYPVYLDTNVMCGRKIIYMQGKPENDFLPMPDEESPPDFPLIKRRDNPSQRSVGQYCSAPHRFGFHRIPLRSFLSSPPVR